MGLFDSFFKIVCIGGMCGRVLGEPLEILLKLTGEPERWRGQSLNPTDTAVLVPPAPLPVDRWCLFHGIIGGC